MIFKHKLSRRLALARALVLLALTGTTACRLDEVLDRGGASAARIVTHPRDAVLQPQQSQSFYAYGITESGDTVVAAVEWRASGGEITPDGTFTASVDAGEHYVVATDVQRLWITDSSMVVIDTSTTDLFLEPDSVLLDGGAVQQFGSYGRRWDNDHAPVDATYAATGGTVSEDGTYEAGFVPGAYHVVAERMVVEMDSTTMSSLVLEVPGNGKGKGQLKRDSSVVVIRAGATTLRRLVLTPPSTYLKPGSTFDFQTYGVLNRGDSVEVRDLLYGASGGRIDPHGRYTAPAETGQYSVIVALKGGGFADTSTVLVTDSDVLVEEVLLEPQSVTLYTGEQEQFTAMGRLSNGDLLPVPAAYAATGGTISADGWYHAGGTPGSFRVIASAEAGTVADTASVTIQANQAPSVSIGAPAEGASFAEGQSVTFTGAADDLEDGQLTGAALVWRSDRDGTLGTGTFVTTASLSAGSHSIALTATDSHGATGSVSVFITIVASNTPPTVSIVQPADASSFPEGQTVTFRGDADDPEDGSLAGNALVWTSDRDGQLGTGASVSRDNLSIGTHRVTLTATDSDGATSSDEISVAIVGNQPPSVTINAPVSGAIFEEGESVTFQGSGNDPEDGSLGGSALVWTSDRDGQLGTGTSISRDDLSVGGHSVTLRASDSQGAPTTATVSITVETAAPPPPQFGTVADPTQLPIHNGQEERTSAYEALGVRGMAAGDSYQDPVTGVTVYKVTDGNTPLGGNVAGGHDYGEGGPHISLPWGAGDEMRTLYVFSRPPPGPTAHYLVDFNTRTGAFTNWRVAPSGNRELYWAFSNNPATPRIGYYIGGPNARTISRYDTGAMAAANTGNFPKDLSSASGGRDLEWIQLDKDDAWFAVQDRNKINTIAWNSQTNRVWSRAVSGNDEPHLDRDGGFVGIVAAQGGGNNALILMNLANGSISNPGANYSSHQTPIRGFFVYAYVYDNGDQYRLNPVTGNVVEMYSSSEYFGGSGHRAGQWVIDNDPGMRQWYVASHWGGGSPTVGKEAVVFVRADGTEVRLLAHHYSNPGSDYHMQPHATVSADGKVVMWKSNQNAGSGGGRSDLFLALTPTR